jgi:acyl-CoA thioester hydrolase
LETCFLGSVNRWECDENDHLNVRYYAQKINQAVAIFLETAGINPTAVRITGQHIRFVQEARIAAPLRVDCGLISGRSGCWEVLSLMRHNLTEAPVSGFITRLKGPGLSASEGAEFVDVPDWAAARGVRPDDPYPLPESPAAAQAAGFRMMGRGRIAAAECDDAGVVLPEIFIGRISDGMPNLWAFTTDDVEREQRQSGELGGAALEYQLDIIRPLGCNEVFRHLSGIREIGNKTQHMVHLLINETRDEVAVRAEAIGVGMDLQSRKAVPISEARRAQLQTLRVS